MHPYESMAQCFSGVLCSLYIARLLIYAGETLNPFQTHHLLCTLLWSLGMLVLSWPPTLDGARWLHPLWWERWTWKPLTSIKLVVGEKKHLTLFLWKWWWMVSVLLFFSMLSSFSFILFLPFYRRNLLEEWEWVSNLFIKYFSFVTWDGQL